jgi:tight adherence protein C
MSFFAVLIGTLFSSGALLLVATIRNSKVSMANSIAPYLGLPNFSELSRDRYFAKIQNALTNGKSSPWASDKRVLLELRRCASDQTLIGFRFEQLAFASIGTIAISFWIVLKIINGQPVQPIIGITLLILGFVGAGGLRSWLLKETSKLRIKNIEAQLPAVLDLLAFAVAAGEPVVTAMKRVAKTCAGELSVEIRRLISGILVGDNFIVSLDRMSKELASQSVSRAFRALIMAIERGTPVADVLRAQAMDARNLEARKLVTLAGKKETLMMIPVVFLILPMIVIVALYPGLVALRTF